MGDKIDEAVRYWKPDAAMRDYVSGYFRFTLAVVPGQVVRDILLPGWAKICFTTDAALPWSVSLRHTTFDPVPDAAFVGPTSHAGYVATRGGTLVGIGLLPVAWNRLFGGDISRFSNKVVPLSAIDPALASIGAAIAAGTPPVEAFDTWIARRIADSPPPDPVIVRLAALIDDPTVRQVRDVADELGLPIRTLADLATRNFGFAPKLLLRRRRFLHALGGIVTQPAEATDLLAAAGYFDRSHFLRDSNLFLGCSPRAFIKRRGPLGPLAMRERARTIGAPL